MKLMFREEPGNGAPRSYKWLSNDMQVGFFRVCAAQCAGPYCDDGGFHLLPQALCPFGPALFPFFSSAPLLPSQCARLHSTYRHGVPCNDADAKTWRLLECLLPTIFHALIQLYIYM